MISDGVAISVRNINKSFKLPHEKQSSLKGLFVNMFNGHRTYEKQQVLKDISFDIEKGDFFGIVGRNGSGKSTLLKLISQIYTPDSGSINVNGKLTPFIELGVGFNPELTGRENVFLNGALLGFTRTEMEDMYEEIVDFAEIERFMDQKLKNYSSGMQVRLAFSIAIRADTDILVLDEVLAVGDSSFQRKCFEYFAHLKEKKTTVVLVTHDMSAVERFCEKVAVVHDNRLVGVFSPSVAAERYDQLNAKYINDKNQQVSSNRKWGTKEVSIKNVSWRLNNKKTKKTTFHTGDKVELAIDLENKDKKDIVVGVSFEDAFGVNIAGPNSLNNNLKAPGKVTYTIDRLPFLQGDYKVTIAIFDKNLVNEYDHHEKIYNIQVISTSRTEYGKVNLFGDWKYE